MKHSQSFGQKSLCMFRCSGTLTSAAKQRLFQGCARLYREMLTESAAVEAAQGRLTSVFQQTLKSMHVKKQAFSSCKKSSVHLAMKMHFTWFRLVHWEPHSSSSRESVQVVPVSMRGRELVDPADGTAVDGDFLSSGRAAGNDEVRTHRGRGAISGEMECNLTPKLHQLKGTLVVASRR